MNEVKDLTSLWIEFYKMLGWLVALILVIISIIFWLMMKFAIKRVEKGAEALVERNLKLFQAQLDRDTHKLATKHSKQLDAIQDIYNTIQNMMEIIDLVTREDKFNPLISNEESVDLLITRRNDFKKTSNLNKLLIPYETRNKILELVPAIDKFIEFYTGGLLLGERIDIAIGDDEQEYIVTGIWNVTESDEVINQLKEIEGEIDLQFQNMLKSN